MSDYELGRFTRRCFLSERELKPGDAYYSALFEEGDNFTRRDYAAEAWQGPPEGAFSWWRSKIPAADAKPTLAPSEVILQYFEQLELQSDRADFRFVLALLMVRRRIVRLEQSETDPAGREVLVMYCATNEREYRTPVVHPTPEQTQRIQEEINRLLYSDAK